MRISEIILEDLEGQKAQRGAFIKRTFGPQWLGVPGYDDIDQFIERVGEIDPSPNGIYMPWIARLAIKKQNENRTEDFDRLSQDLQNFEQFKTKLEKKDINQYKSFAEVFTAIEPFLQPRKKTTAEKKADRELAKKQTARADIIDVYSGQEGWVKIPTSQAAAKYLGQNTRWCTAATKNNMFDEYNKSDKLFVIYDKASGARYQLHIHGGQFMDVKDSPVDKTAIPEWARQPIITWYRENNPNLSMKQLMYMSNWTKENLATGTEHEEIVDLMKQYGVL